MRAHYLHVFRRTQAISPVDIRLATSTADPAACLHVRQQAGIGAAQAIIDDGLFGLQVCTDLGLLCEKVVLGVVAVFRAAGLGMMAAEKPDGRTAHLFCVESRRCRDDVILMRILCGLVCYPSFLILQVVSRS